MTQFSIMTPIEELGLAIARTEQNPEAWEAVVSWAHQDREANVDPSTRLYLCILRRPHFSSLLGLRRMLGSLARLLNLRYPHLQCPTRDRATRLKRGAAA